MTKIDSSVLSASGKTSVKNRTTFRCGVQYYSVSSSACLIPTIHAVNNVSGLIFSSCISSSYFDWSNQAFGNLGSVSMDLRLMPVLYTISNSDSDSRRSHCVSFTNTYDICNSHLRASLPVLTVNQFPSRYGQSSNMAYTTARRPLCVVVSFSQWR